MTDVQVREVQAAIKARATKGLQVGKRVAQGKVRLLTLATVRTDQLGG